jgi:hypothetical protein
MAAPKHLGTINHLEPRTALLGTQPSHGQKGVWKVFKLLMKSGVKSNLLEFVWYGEYLSPENSTLLKSLNLSVGTK